jgi:arsenate reductase
MRRSSVHDPTSARTPEEETIVSTHIDPTLSVPPEIGASVATIAERLAEEFDGMFSPETVRLAVAESCEDFENAKVMTFVPAFVERFTRQRLDARARTEGKVAATTPLVVFLCVHNAGRSQMAAAWLRYLGGDGVEIFSGGSDPGSVVNPAAIASMKEVGIDIALEFPKPWTEDVLRAADVIVTMGCGDACPVFPGTRYLDWKVDDPAGLPVEAVRPIRDDIERRVRGLMTELGIPPARA